MTNEHPVPTEDEIRGYFERCSNWGRWGPDDNAGTVNLITPEVRRKAASLVSTGRAISLSRRWNTVGGPGNSNPAQHFLRKTDAVSIDYLGIIYHGHSTTHIDALCHIFWEGKGWNGRPSDEVTSIGARFGSVDAWSSGIATRGVLLDIPRLREVDFVDLNKPVRGWELEAAAKAEGVSLEPGDAVLVYSGREKFFESHPDSVPGTAPTAGLHADVCPVLKDRDAALLGWDQLDARPSGYEMFENPPFPGGPVHVFAIVYMGLPLLDNSLLQPLAESCAEESRWEFMLTINPLNVRGATGSPVNPIALF
ncbi:MAG TPA: cyclase family protein [Dehalococcoidia bacterium]|nr:cyclase family protein [Dehalococcoidia bacterium]